MPWREELLGELLAALEPRREPAGPEAGEPGGCKRVDDARDQRALGPDDREADAFGPGERDEPGDVGRPATGALRHFGSSAVPALPGATRTSDTRGDCASFQASACSRPPPPMTRSFTASVPEVAHAGEDHRDAALVGGGDDLVVAHEPPGWMTARMPSSAAASRPSRNGKKASEAIDAARDFELRVGRLHRGDAGRDDAARLPGADADRAAVPREHDRVRLHVLAHAPGEQQVRELGGGRCAARDGLSAPASTWPSSCVCTSRPPATDLSSSAGAGCGRARRFPARGRSACRRERRGHRARRPAPRSPRRTGARRSPPLSRRRAGG